MLNQRWQHLTFNPISNRVAALDVQIGAAMTVRIVGVYMPHTEQPDTFCCDAKKIIISSCENRSEEETPDPRVARAAAVDTRAPTTGSVVPTLAVLPGVFGRRALEDRRYPSEPTDSPDDSGGE